MYNKKDVGKRIKEIRMKNGKTQAQFGEIFSASKGNVAMWEKGATLPNVDRLNKISDFANITVNELLLGKEYTLETIKELYDENFEELQKLIFELVNDFVKRYYDTEDKIFYELELKDIYYFKELFERLIYHEEFNISEKDEFKKKDKATINIVGVFTNIILKDIKEVSIDSYDSRKEYVETIAYYLSYKESFSEQLFEYLIFICERISKNSPDTLKMMLLKQVNDLVSKVNDTVFDYDNESNNDSYYKIFNKITNNNYLVSKDSLVKTITNDEYREIIKQLNQLSYTIDNISDKGDTY
ncbi:helix-turn-helix domain-containing protein [Mammaliicoccus sciuri]|uniref:helix-turn-helix domain-containing protein n=1 Tax=Mammaliicoccus sciuri TaxID=1296 RepID=UPI001E2A5E48|nr:helix-turn-helix domain-containing protein [Mammaliicoccus sciuri]MCD8795311.1 helix-turn-helix domain-containing protein [Mammaliicoccus sciuri]